MTTPEGFQTEEERVFKNGDIVKVKRSSGVIEDDWKISDFDTEAGRYVLHKDDNENDKLMVKRITPEELESWNS
jgi:hypothetical protein